MVLRSQFSQFLLFSEYPIMSPNFVRSLHNASESRRACWQSKTFPGILISSRVFRSIPISRQHLAWLSWWRWSFITHSLSLTLSMLWLASNNLCLWESSSRCDSNNAYSEFLRSIFWISMLHSVEYNFLWIEISPRIACWALPSRCPRRSHPSEQNFLWVWREWLLILFRRPFFDIDSAALITKPSLSFLSLGQVTVSRLHTFFAFTDEKRAKQRIQTLVKHQTVQYSRVCFSRSQRFLCGLDRQWASCHHPRKYYCRTSWAHDLCGGRTWPGN